MRYEFDAPLWRWESRQDLWTFVSLPEEASDEIHDLVGPRTGGFQSVRVDVLIGATAWRTSIFGGDGDRYALPVKKAVRAKEHLELGDTVHCHVELVDF